MLELVHQVCQPLTRFSSFSGSQLIFLDPWKTIPFLSLLTSDSFSVGFAGIRQPPSLRLQLHLQLSLLLAKTSDLCMELDHLERAEPAKKIFPHHLISPLDYSCLLFFHLLLQLPYLGLANETRNSFKYFSFLSSSSILIIFPLFNPINELILPKAPGL